METINQLKFIPLSDGEITEHFKKLKQDANIVILGKMNHINNIDQLFNGTDHVILYVATVSQFSGHWQLLLRKNNQILFYDSYGKPFSYILKQVINKYNQTDKLSKIIIKSKIPTEHNTVQYQSDNMDVSTCGYHVLVCFCVFLELGEKFTFKIYKKFMDRYKTKYKLKDYDQVVVKIGIV